MTISKQMHLDPSHMYDHANQHRRINNKYKTEKQPKKRYLPNFAEHNTKCAYLSHWYVYVDVIHIAYVNYIIHCNRALSRIQIKGRKTGERQCRCIQRNPNVFSS